MWAIRRAYHPLRSHGLLEAPRMLFTKLDKLCYALENLEENQSSDSSGAGTYPPAVGHFNGSSFHKFFQGRTLSSQAGTKNEEGHLEGFSELEGLQSDGEAAAEELISEPDLSDEESDGTSSQSFQHEVQLSDDESPLKGAKELPRKTVDTPLFKVIMETPRSSISSVLDKWVEEGKPMGRTEISLAMLNLRKRRLFWKALELMEWVKAKGQLDFTERDYASHLDLIAKVNGLQNAENFIGKIPKSFQSEVIYRTLLANCVSTLDVNKAEEIFNKIRELGFSLSVFVCNQLLMLYKRVDRKKIADVLLMMEKENVKPSRFTYRLLVDTKGRAKDMAGMDQVIEAMKADALEPDLALQATVARHYIINKLNEKAQQILKEMEGDNLKENRAACKLLLPLYAALGDADEVGRIWKVCEAHPRVDECLAAIEAWGKLGRVESAEAVFEKMLKTWKKLSQKCYTALLKVYADHKLLVKGKELAKQMSEDVGQIGPLALDALIKLYVESGEVSKADSILQKAYQQNQAKPLYSSFLTVMDRYAEQGDIHNTEKIFHRMRQAGYPGRMGQYQTLLSAYVKAKAPAYGFRERMKADKLFPNRPVAALLAKVDAFRKTPISDLLD